MSVHEGRKYVPNRTFLLCVIQPSFFFLMKHNLCDSRSGFCYRKSRGFPCFTDSLPSGSKDMDHKLELNLEEIRWPDTKEGVFCSGKDPVFH